MPSIFKLADSITKSIVKGHQKNRMPKDFALLVLDENAPIDDMINTVLRVKQFLENKTRGRGIVVMVNDEAIKGNEISFMKGAKIQFFQDWPTNLTYRNMIRDALESDHKFIMKKQNERWTFTEALPNDYEILDPDGMINIVPKRP